MKHLLLTGIATKYSRERVLGSRFTTGSDSDSDSDSSDNDSNDNDNDNGYSKDIDNDSDDSDNDNKYSDNDSDSYLLYAVLFLGGTNASVLIPTPCKQGTR